MGHRWLYHHDASGHFWVCHLNFYSRNCFRGKIRTLIQLLVSTYIMTLFTVMYSERGFDCRISQQSVDSLAFLGTFGEQKYVVFTSHFILVG